MKGMTLEEHIDNQVREALKEDEDAKRKKREWKLLSGLESDPLPRTKEKVETHYENSGVLLEPYFALYYEKKGVFKKIDAYMHTVYPHDTIWLKNERERNGTKD